MSGRKTGVYTILKRALLGGHELWTQGLISHRIASSRQPSGIQGNQEHSRLLSTDICKRFFLVSVGDVCTHSMKDAYLPEHASALYIYIVS